MGYDLTNQNGDYLRFSIHNWGYFLKKLYEYGWEPEGTQFPVELAQAYSESTKTVSDEFYYTVFFEMEDGGSTGICLSTDKRLTAEQIEDVKHNPKVYFSADTLEGDGFFFNPVKPFKVTKVEEPDRKPQEIKTAQQIMDEWDGGYFSNNAQLITDEDCKQFVTILAREGMKDNAFFDTSEPDFSKMSESERKIYEASKEMFLGAILKTNNNMVEFFKHPPVSIG